MLFNKCGRKDCFTIAGETKLHEILVDASLTTKEWLSLVNLIVRTKGCACSLYEPDIVEGWVTSHGGLAILPACGTIAAITPSFSFSSTH